MIKIRKISVGALGLVLVLSGVAGISGSAYASTPSKGSDQQPDREPEFVTLDFAHPVALSEATTVRQAAGVEVRGYHFISDSITGDFWPSSGMSVEDFLTDVAEHTGTAPEVTAVYVRSAEYQKVAGTYRSAVQLGDELPAFDAPDANALLMPRASSDGSAESSSRTMAAAGQSWQPTSVNSLVKNTGSTIAISGYFSWFSDQYSSPKASPAFMDNGWGMEFQYDFYTSMRPNLDTTTPPPIMYGSRPYCGTTAINYKDWAAASNQPFSWFAWVTAGASPRVVAPAALKLYGDFNDLSDPCTVSTIAVGMANPQAASATATSYQLELQMYPSRGNDATSKLGAIVQPVTKDWCNRFPAMTLTDCMGVTAATYPGPGLADSRMVLNAANGNRAPNLCWFSSNFGTTAAGIYTCP